MTGQIINQRSRERGRPSPGAPRSGYPRTTGRKFTLSYVFRRGQMRTTRICEWCGEEYWTSNGKAKYCCDECRKAARKKERHKEYQREWRETHPEYDAEWRKANPGYDRDRHRKLRGSKLYTRVCPVCGAEFTTWLPHKETCTEKCSRRLRNLGHQKYADRRIERIQENGYVDKSITLAKLLKRDNGICYLCGEKVDVDDYIIRDDIKIVGDNYPSIDHIVPVAKGGTHTWDNVKLAHKICNSKKGAK